MPTVTVLPHESLCPTGATFTAATGARLCDALQDNGIALEHACEKACVCTTCHVLVRSGFVSLRPASDDEEDQLGKAWGIGILSTMPWFIFGMLPAAPTAFRIR